MTIVTQQQSLNLDHNSLLLELNNLSTIINMDTISVTDGVALYVVQLNVAISVCCLQIAEIGVTEHIEGDQCKFALWTGSVPTMSDTKIILRVSVLWVCRKGLLASNASSSSFAC